MMLRDARKLGLISSLFNFTTVISFYSRDTYYTGIKSNNWRSITWAFPGKPPVLLWKIM